MGTKLPAFVGPKGTIDTPAFYEGQVGWGNHSMPDVYVVDVNPNYPVGTKFIDGERTFVYGYCYENLASADRAMGGMMNRADEVYPATKAVAHKLGETEIVIVDNSSAVNLWAGGFCMPRDHPYSYYRILSSTATDNTNVTLTLERGLINALDSGDSIFVNQHPYSKMACLLPGSSDEWVSAVGVNLALAVASRYMWVQTWGPCFVTGGDERLGNAEWRRNATFHMDGTLMCPSTLDQKQYAGYALSRTSGTRSTWFIYLMINR